MYGRTQVRDAMVNLGFVTGFVRPYPGTRRDGQLRICHRLCNIPHWFWRASQVTFCHLACTPVPRYERTKQAFFYVTPLWNPYLSHTNSPRMYARTHVRAYEPSDVLSLGLHAGITDAACKAQNFNLTSGFWPGHLVWLRAMADASVVAAQRQQAEAQKALVRLIPAY